MTTISTIKKRVLFVLKKNYFTFSTFDLVNLDKQFSDEFMKIKWFGSHKMGFVICLSGYQYIYILVKAAHAMHVLAMGKKSSDYDQL